MINPITLRWNFRHQKLLKETRALTNLKLFLEKCCEIRHDFSVGELKAARQALKKG